MQYKYFHSILYITIFVLAIIFMVPSIEYNTTNYWLLELLFKPSKLEIGDVKLSMSGCQALLYSHVLAAYDIQAAKAPLLYAKDCPDKDLLSYWAGELEYRQGNLNDAKKYWEEMNSHLIIDWGIHEYYFGDRDKAKFILEVVANNPTQENKLLYFEKSDLYGTLAEIYNKNGDFKRSLVLYYMAWDQGKNDYLMSYHLGSAYYQNGSFDEAIRVMEIGLGNKPRYFLSQLEFSYYIRLVELYINIDDILHATYYIEAAKKTLAMEIEFNTSPDVLEYQQNRLNQLISILEGGQ